MAKNNNGKIWRIIGVIALVGGVLVSIALAYGALNLQVEHNSVQLEKHTQKIESHERAVIEIKKDIGFILTGIKDIKKDLSVKNPQENK